MPVAGASASSRKLGPRRPANLDLVAAPCPPSPPGLSGSLVLAHPPWPAHAQHRAGPEGVLGSMPSTRAAAVCIRGPALEESETHSKALAARKVPVWWQSETWIRLGSRI